MRNAAIALGNQPSAEGLKSLSIGINDNEPLVRGASAWAIGRHKSFGGWEVLEKRKSIETDVDVLREIEIAMSPHD